MNLFRVFCAACLACCFAGVAPAIDVDNPPKGTFADEWYAVMMKGQKSGHAHITMERAPGKGREIIRTRNDMKLALKRMGQTIEANVIEQTLETLDGEPLAFSMHMQTSGLAIVKTGRIRGDKVEISSQIGQLADKVTKTYKLPEGAIMSWGLYRAEAKRGIEVGMKYKLEVYVPHLSPEKLIPVEVEVLSRETIDLFGRKVETYKVRETMTMPGMLGQTTKMDTVNYINEDGDILRTDLEMEGFPLQLIACSKTVAMAPNDPAELMEQMLITVDEPIDRDAKAVHYRLKLRSATGRSTLPKLPDTDVQEVRLQAGRIVELVVRQPKPFGQGNPDGRMSDKDRERYLAASAIINHKDPAVAALARKAAGDEKNPWKLADKLRRFVSDYVSTKNLNVGFATASEVARSREGDCSEHGVLLAALGRANGIPSRLVTGLIYVDQFEGHKHVFGGHMWTQFYIDGRWVDLDAAQDQTEIEPTHIAISLTDGGDAGFAEMTSTLWFNLGNLDIEIVKQEK